MMLIIQARVSVATEKIQGLNGWLIDWPKDSLTSESKWYLWYSLLANAETYRQVDADHGAEELNCIGWSQPYGLTQYKIKSVTV